MKYFIVLFFAVNFIFAQEGKKENKVEKELPPTGVLDNQKYSQRYYKNYEEATKTKLQREYYSFTDEKDKSRLRKLTKKEIDGYFTEKVLFKQEEESFYLFVPKTYNGEKTFGIYIHISPSVQPLKLNKAWQDVCIKHDLIFISPYKADNKTSVWRRTILGMDAFATIREVYKINPKRIYGGGMSGGGATAIYFPAVAPTVFAGIISMVRGVSPCSLPPSFFDKKIEHVRIAFVSGEKDFNYSHSKASTEEWLKEKNTKFVKFYDIPGMGHTNISPKVFDDIITDFEHTDLKTYKKPRIKKDTEKKKKRK